MSLHHCIFSHRQGRPVRALALAFGLLSPALAACLGPESIESDLEVEGAQEKIVHGTPVDNINEYEFAAYVENCGGTFIHPSWVLSAAHCWRPNYERLRTVSYGHLDHTQGSRAASRAIHSLSEYRALSDSEAYGIEPYDIVLVQLGSPVPVAKIALLPSTPSQAGELLTLVGWGATESSSSSPVLKKVDLLVGGPDGRAANKFFANGLGGLGAGGPGDSGGGVFRRADGRQEIVGIASTSNRTNHTTFTEVYAYLNWISSVSGVTRESQATFTISDGTLADGTVVYLQNYAHKSIINGTPGLFDGDLHLTGYQASSDFVLRRHSESVGYTIENETTGQCFDMHQPTRAVSATCHGQSSQQFTFEQQADGLWKIRSQIDGKCLQAYRDGWPFFNVHIRAVLCEETDDQRWSVYRSEN